MIIKRQGNYKWTAEMNFSAYCDAVSPLLQNKKGKEVTTGQAWLHTNWNYSTSTTYFKRIMDTLIEQEKAVLVGKKGRWRLLVDKVKL